jgi:hypothetical protein
VSLENAEVFCFRGANIGEIIYKLERNKKMFEKYMNFIVLVGTNDVQKLSAPLKQKTSAFSNDTYLASIESEIITKFLIL